MPKKELVVHVSDIRASSSHGVHRVTADVNGVPLWYESDGTELCAISEVFGTSLLLPALHRNCRLILDAPVSATWLSNIEQLLAIWHRWWNYAILLPQAETRSPTISPSPRGTALCFSGGVDSFYSLLHNEHKPDLLVTVHGFDIPLHDHARMTAVDNCLRSVAAKLGVKPVVIRTNFREHPAAGPARLWERSHGGVLASVGHLLGNSICKLTISSSVYRYQNSQPWGSNFETDHLWSSDRLSVLHYGAEAFRNDKIRFLAHEPLAREHLRVCWENRAPCGNCSRCEKCLLVMLILAEYGVLDEFPVFEDENVLVQRIKALPYLKDFMKVVERSLQGGRLKPELAEAAHNLVKRSRRVEKIRTPIMRVRDAFI